MLDCGRSLFCSKFEAQAAKPRVAFFYLPLISLIRDLRIKTAANIWRFASINHALLIWCYRNAAGAYYYTKVQIVLLVLFSDSQFAWIGRLHEPSLEARIERIRFSGVNTGLSE